MERSVRFYEPLLHFFEMKTIARTPEIFYCVGSRTGMAISKADPEHAGDRFHQRRIRIEVNHVPGRGHLDPNTRLPLVDTLSG